MPKPKRDEEEPEEAKEEGVWGVADIPTQTAPVITNKNSKENYDIFTAMAHLLNKVDELHRIASEE